MNVLLVRDKNGDCEYVADYFLYPKTENAKQVALRIGRQLSASRNRHGITRVAVIQDGSWVSRIVDVSRPGAVTFSDEFTTRRFLKNKRSYFNL
jgi:hypothetical protein